MDSDSTISEKTQTASSSNSDNEQPELVVKGKSLNILVKSFTGSTITVRCKEGNTVGHVAQQILDYEDYKRNQATIWELELISGGRVLEPESKLVENGIREMSTIKCMLVSK